MNHSKTELKEFTEKYCTTLKQDEKGQYIKVYFDNYEHLQSATDYLNIAIETVGHSLEYDKANPTETGFCIAYLCHFLNATLIMPECEGLSQLQKLSLKTQPPF